MQVQSLCAMAAEAEELLTEADATTAELQVHTCLYAESFSSCLHCCASHDFCRPAVLHLLLLSAPSPQLWLATLSCSDMSCTAMELR